MFSSPKQKFLSIPSWIIIAFLVISIIGFADASYLTAQHFRGVGPNCSISDMCEIITKSTYSVVFGIPVALGGAVYYLVIFVGTLLYYEKSYQLFHKIIPYITTIGFLFSIWFVYLQLFVLHAICMYCMGSAISSILLFILGMYIIYLSRKDK